MGSSRISVIFFVQYFSIWNQKSIFKFIESIWSQTNIKLESIKVTGKLHAAVSTFNASIQTKIMDKKRAKKREKNSCEMK